MPIFRIGDACENADCSSTVIAGLINGNALVGVTATVAVAVARRHEAGGVGVGERSQEAGFVPRRDQHGVRNDAQPPTDPLHGDRSDLFGLRLGVAIEPGDRGRKQDLERVDPFDVG